MAKATHFDYFPSGSNAPAEIAAFRSLAFHVGVAANELSAEGEAELLKYAGTGLLVFVDSGAFGEVEFPKNAPPRIGTTKGGKSKEITDAEWDKRLGLYERLAPVLREQLYVVAPDRVGCQRTTLERMARYADRVQAIAAHGCNVIVPLQRGALTAIEFDKIAGATLGLSEHVRGIPLKNAATTWEGFGELAASLPAGTRVHLLGKGPGSKPVKDAAGRGHGFADFLEAVAHLAVTCDSVALRRLVGRTNGPDNGPRDLTVAQDCFRAAFGLPPAFGPGNARLQGADAYRVKFAAVREVFAGLPHLAPAGQLPLALVA